MVGQEGRRDGEEDRKPRMNGSIVAADEGAAASGTRLKSDGGGDRSKEIGTFFVLFRGVESESENETCFLCFGGEKNRRLLTVERESKGVVGVCFCGREKGRGWYRKGKRRRK